MHGVCACVCIWLRVCVFVSLFFFMSLYKLLETFRALMKHPRPCTVAHWFTVCSSSFLQYSDTFFYNIHIQHCGGSSVHLSSALLVCVPPCLWVSPKINETKPNPTDHYKWPKHNQKLQPSQFNFALVLIFVLCPSSRERQLWLIVWDMRLQFESAQERAKLSFTPPRFSGQ